MTYLGNQRSLREAGFQVNLGLKINLLCWRSIDDVSAVKFCQYL